MIGMETSSWRKRPFETNTNGGSTNWNGCGEGRRKEDYKPLTRRRLDLALGPTRDESSYDEGNTNNTKYASELVREKIKEIMVLKRESVTYHSTSILYFIFTSIILLTTTIKDIERSGRTHSCHDSCQFNFL